MQRYRWHFGSWHQNCIQKNLQKSWVQSSVCTKRCLVSLGCCWSRRVGFITKKIYLQSTSGRFYCPKKSIYNLPFFTQTPTIKWNPYVSSIYDISVINPMTCISFSKSFLENSKGGPQSGHELAKDKLVVSYAICTLSNKGHPSNRDWGGGWTLWSAQGKSIVLNIWNFHLISASNSNHFSLALAFNCQYISQQHQILLQTHLLALKVAPNFTQLSLASEVASNFTQNSLTAASILTQDFFA